MSVSVWKRKGVAGKEGKDGEVEEVCILSFLCYCL